ncbi:hypothetical protein BN2476_1240025 [Paraburkholderia piptadeniae]|uniref:Uncharacterized protein n=1 Tax=Paraburkholderia piptadeniae TaxID=1701573 RepID=A0A1N7SXC9_9BURK|nr:hypothetical protein BN2476_1240025 [Paraburkholderia piptadeniae]
MCGVMGVMNQIAVRTNEAAADVGAQRDFAGIAIDAQDGVAVRHGRLACQSVRPAGRRDPRRTCAKWSTISPSCEFRGANSRSGSTKRHDQRTGR